MRFRQAPEGFRERLTEAFYKSDLSTADIERMTGINHTNIFTLSCLCNVLHVSADYLLFGR